MAWIGLVPALASAEVPASRYLDLSDEIARSQLQIEMLRSQGRHGEAAVAAQRIERMVDAAAQALKGDEPDAAEMAWLVVQRWQDRADRCAVPEGSGAVLPAEAVTPAMAACEWLEKSVGLALRARAWAPRRRDFEQTPPTYEQLSEVALEQLARLLVVRAGLPAKHPLAVPASVVPPPYQVWPWTDAARADAAGKIRVARAGKPRGALVPVAEQWLALALELERMASPLAPPWTVAQFLLRNGFVRVDGAVGEDERDGVAQLQRAVLPTGVDGDALAVWLAVQQPKKRSLDPKDWVAEERLAWCDQPGRPCAPLRLATLPADAELRVLVGANACSGDEALLLRFRGGSALTLLVPGCPAYPLEAQLASAVDGALAWYAFSYPSGRGTLATSVEVSARRGARQVAQESYPPRPTAGREDLLYQLAAAACARPATGGRSKPVKVPPGTDYGACRVSHP
ncbi:MAG: hypothetical protein HY902_16640 [Deltaproteobacteria bacterium]|nr:hypothetical protein [Deltaproteobacteria bacterium]